MWLLRLFLVCFWLGGPLAMYVTFVWLCLLSRWYEFKYPVLLIRLTRLFVTAALESKRECKVLGS